MVLTTTLILFTSYYFLLQLWMMERDEIREIRERERERETERETFFFYDDTHRHTHISSLDSAHHHEPRILAICVFGIIYVCAGNDFSRSSSSISSEFDSMLSM